MSEKRKINNFKVQESRLKTSLLYVLPTMVFSIKIVLTLLTFFIPTVEFGLANDFYMLVMITFCFFDQFWISFKNRSNLLDLFLIQLSLALMIAVYVCFMFVKWPDLEGFGQNFEPMPLCLGFCLHCTFVLYIKRGALVIKILTQSTKIIAHSSILRYKDQLLQDMKEGVPK